MKIIKKHTFVCGCVSLIVLLCTLPTNSAVVTKSGGYSAGGGGVSSSQIRKLINEKRQKYAQLEQCTKKVTGFKITGISTLGLTAVGVGGNVALASKNKDLERDINNTRTKIEEEQKKKADIEAKIETENQRIKKEKCDKDATMKWENGACVPKGEGGAENVPPALTDEDCKKENKVLKNGVCVTEESNNNAQNNSECTDFVERVNAVRPGCISEDKKHDFCKSEFYSAETIQDEPNALLVKYTAPGEDYSNNPMRIECDKKSVTPADEDRVIESVENEEQEQSATLDVSENGSLGVYKGLNDDRSHVVPYGSEVDRCVVSNNGDWCVQFREYIVGGVSTCASSYNKERQGGKAVEQNLIEREQKGKICYCKITSWKPNNGSKENKSSVWVYGNWYDDVEHCVNSCSYACTGHVRSSSDFRRELFESIAD